MTMMLECCDDINIFNQSGGTVRFEPIGIQTSIISSYKVSGLT